MRIACFVIINPSNVLTHVLDLTVDQLRDIRGLPIILFSDHNVKRWHEIHSVFVNITNHDFAKKFALRNPVAFEELAGLDRQRGFRLRDLIEM